MPGMRKNFEHMQARSRFIAALGCALCILVLSGFSCSNEKTGQVTVTISDKAYSPGKITVAELSTYVAVARNIARDAVRKLSAGKVKGKTMKVRALED